MRPHRAVQAGDGRRSTFWQCFHVCPPSALHTALSDPRHAAECSDRPPVLAAQGTDCRGKACPRLLRRSTPTEGFERDPPMAEAWGRSRPQIGAQTGDTAVLSLDPAVRNRKAQSRTQSLAAQVPAGLRPCLLTQQALSTALMASQGASGVRVTVSTSVAALPPGAPPLCPRRSSPPPYKSAALAATRRKAQTQILADQRVAATLARDAHPTGSRGQAPLASTIAGAPACNTGCTASAEDFALSFSGTAPPTPQRSPATLASPSTSTIKPEACVRSSTYFEEYLWPFPAAEPFVSPHLDAMPDIFGMPYDEDTSWAETFSPISLDFSDVTSQPEVTECVADDEPGHAAPTGVSALHDLQALTTTPEQAAQMDTAVDASETGGRKIKRKAMQIAQDAQVASALERETRRKKPGRGAARPDTERTRALVSDSQQCDAPSKWQSCHDQVSVRPRDVCSKMIVGLIDAEARRHPQEGSAINVRSVRCSRLT